MTLSDNLLVEGAVVLLAGVAAGYGMMRLRERQIKTSLAAREQSALETARREAESITREARLSANEEVLKLREQTEKAFASRRSELAGLEQRLTQRENLINTQLAGLVEQEKSLREKQREMESGQIELDLARQEAARIASLRREQLQKTANLTESEARAALLKEVEDQSLRDGISLSRHIIDNAKAKAEEQARKLIGLAIQRYAGSHTSETSMAIVAIQGDDIKGRIIGREGRNIRAFEAATGITVLIDDTPNAVVLSGFDPVRREIAREAMHRLILDGRIHPTRIEEIVAKVTEEIDGEIVRFGEEAVFKLGLPPMHPEVLKLLGRLHFRHSFAQNLLDHSVEVAHLTALIAAELGVDVTAAKRAGLLHDIGKALSHEVEGSHAIIGADFVNRFGESPDVVNGVASHHDEVPHTNILGILVSAADAISASRPGARSETMTTYIKRIENLERIGLSFSGVDKCFAVQAGRELRVFVHPSQVDDEHAYLLARNIVRKIEDELQYPGQIRVTVVRETRCIEFAK
jgi:ribonuclease Y